MPESTQPDFTTLRAAMIDQQLRRRGIRQERVLAAIERPFWVQSEQNVQRESMLRRRSKMTAEHGQNVRATRRASETLTLRKLPETWPVFHCPFNRASGLARSEGGGAAVSAGIRRIRS